MIVVGLTGSLASGKSQAAKAFEKLGAKIFDADLSAKKALRKKGPAYKAVLSLFGKFFLKTNGEFDRQRIAQHVFDRPSALKKLNRIVHPLVMDEAMELIHRCRGKRGVLILDVPLLFESKMDGLADITICVRTQKQEIIRRAQKKFNSTLAKKILSAQWSVDRKARLSDVVINNNGSLGDLDRKIRAVYNKITKSKQGGN